MSDAKRTVILDRERELRFDYNAICDVEELTGRNVVDDIAQNRIASFTYLRALLWAGLKHEDPELTPLAVGMWIKAPQVKALNKAVAAALTDFFGGKG